MSKLKKVPALMAAARDARRRTGKGVLTQLVEMHRLRRGYGALAPFDYYAYHVFDDVKYPGATKCDVVSWDVRVLARLNNPRWRELADDKLLLYALLASFDIPVPPLVGVYEPRGRLFGKVPCMTGKADTESFLRTLDRPVFGKPLRGMLGRGASSIERYDPATDELILAFDQRIAVCRYVEAYVLPATRGYLFQDRVASHPELVPITGHTVSTLRMVVLNGISGPTLFRAVWKMAIGNQITDNYLRGVAGNLKAWIDVKDGQVVAAFHGRGSRTGPSPYSPESLGRYVECHPHTGRQIVGILVPFWNEAVELVMRAARHLPGMRYQSWDVALGDRGPTIFELNAGGMPQQLPGFPGMGDDTLRRFIREERDFAMGEHDRMLGRHPMVDIFRHRGVDG
jgi:hypothetical protein